MGLITILGDLGDGKTLLMLVLAYYENIPIVSNFNITLPDRKIENFDINKFIQAQYENCAILLDEAYVYLESRISGSELNQIMGYILLQSRKKNVHLYITAQMLSSIDKRYREMSDIYIIANRISIDFSYTLIMRKKGIISEIAFDYEKFSLFFEYYDTNEVILTTNKKIIFETLPDEQKEVKIDEYATEIQQYYEQQYLTNVTRSMVALYMRKHSHIPKFLLDDIFASIKLDKKSEKVEITAKKSKRSKKKDE